MHGVSLWNRGHSVSVKIISEPRVQNAWNLIRFCDRVYRESKYRIEMSWIAADIYRSSLKWKVWCQVMVFLIRNFEVKSFAFNGVTCNIFSCMFMSLLRSSWNHFSFALLLLICIAVDIWLFGDQCKMLTQKESLNLFFWHCPSVMSFMLYTPHIDITFLILFWKR